MLRRVLASPRSRSVCRAYLVLLFLSLGVAAVAYGFTHGGDLAPSVAVAHPLDVADAHSIGLSDGDSARIAVAQALTGATATAGTQPTGGTTPGVDTLSGPALDSSSPAGARTTSTAQSDTMAGSAQSAAGADQVAAATALSAAPAVTEPVVFRSYNGPIDEALEQELLATGVLRADTPVPVANLHLITVRYWDFAGHVQSGQLIVNEMWAAQICSVFKTLFDAHFPIRRMDPLHFNTITGTDIVASDNTAGFQTRRVNGGWSMHAYGLAVDINPAENPWVAGGGSIPEIGVAFKDRATYSTGMVQANSVVVKAFAAIGWKWGGNWTGSQDYMHFSSNGR